MPCPGCCFRLAIIVADQLSKLAILAHFQLHETLAADRRVC